MRLTDILQEDCVKVPLDHEDKQQAIYELVDLLADKAGIAAADNLKQAVWQRETTRTTGIGHGIGVPHGKSPEITRLCMAVGRPKTPMDFRAIDGRPVNLIFLVASPMNQTGPHIEALARISRMWTDESLRAALENADSAQAIYRIIAEHEARTGM